MAPVLAAHGLALDDLDFRTERAGWILRLTIEKPGSTEDSGGVTLADCADVSRDVSTVLDVEDLIPQHYSLEVSSPGLERPLRRASDFARFVGKLARVKLSQPAPDGQRLLRGELVEAGPDKVAMVVDGKRVEVPYAHVSEANLVFELVPQPKKNVLRAKKPRAGARSPAEPLGASARPSGRARKAKSHPGR
ncbi:MAG: ribosome maturation factor RimP [Polyangiaceae bacterium]